MKDVYKFTTFKFRLYVSFQVENVYFRSTEVVHCYSIIYSFIKLRVISFKELFEIRRKSFQKKKLDRW